MLAKAQLSLVPIVSTPRLHQSAPTGNFVSDVGGSIGTIRLRAAAISHTQKSNGKFNEPLRYRNDAVEFIIAQSSLMATMYVFMRECIYDIYKCQPGETQWQLFPCHELYVYLIPSCFVTVLGNTIYHLTFYNHAQPAIYLTRLCSTSYTKRFITDFGIYDEKLQSTRFI